MYQACLEIVRHESWITTGSYDMDICLVATKLFQDLYATRKLARCKVEYMLCGVLKIACARYGIHREMNEILRCIGCGNWTTGTTAYNKVYRAYLSYGR